MRRGDVSRLGKRTLRRSFIYVGVVDVRAGWYTSTAAQMCPLAFLRRCVWVPTRENAPCPRGTCRAVDTLPPDGLLTRRNGNVFLYSGVPAAPALRWNQQLARALRIQRLSQNSTKREGCLCTFVKITDGGTQCVRLGYLYSLRFARGVKSKRTGSNERWM